MKIEVKMVKNIVNVLEITLHVEETLSDGTKSSGEMVFKRDRKNNRNTWYLLGVNTGFSQLRVETAKKVIDALEETKYRNFELPSTGERS